MFDHTETVSSGMSLDETIYKDPEVFNPDRFVAKPGHTPEPFFHSVFGFGRRFDTNVFAGLVLTCGRICPGSVLGDASIFIAVVCILSVFDISKAIGPDEKDIEPKVEFSSGIVE